MPSNCKLPDPSGVVALSGVEELGQPEGGRSDLTGHCSSYTHVHTWSHLCFFRNNKNFPREKAHADEEKPRQSVKRR